MINLIGMSYVFEINRNAKDQKTWLHGRKYFYLTYQTVTPGKCVIYEKQREPHSLKYEVYLYQFVRESVFAYFISATITTQTIKRTHI